jgi:hypothetical protein
MKIDRQLRPSVERIESRALLSVGMASMAGASAIHALAIRPHVLNLSGEASGRWSTSFGNPDVGRTTNLIGNGTISPLNAVSVTGSLHAPGFIARGRATGMLVLTNAQGSVTLQLRGPLQKGFSARPSTFSFRIVDSSGAYARSIGRGTAQISLLEADPLPPPGISAGPAIIVGPIFTLTLK